MSKGENVNFKKRVEKKGKKTMGRRWENKQTRMGIGWWDRNGEEKLS